MEGLPDANGAERRTESVDDPPVVTEAHRATDRLAEEARGNAARHPSEEAEPETDAQESGPICRRLRRCDRVVEAAVHRDHAHGERGGKGSMDTERLFSHSPERAYWPMSSEFEIENGVSSVLVHLGTKSIARIESPAMAATVLSDLGPVAEAGDGTVTLEGDADISVGDAWVAYAEAAERAGDVFAAERAWSKITSAQPDGSPRWRSGMARRLDLLARLDGRHDDLCRVIADARRYRHLATDSERATLEAAADTHTCAAF